MRLSRIKHILWMVSAGLLLGLASGISLAQDGVVQLQPVDEGDRDPLLLQFRERMQRAVNHREPERLVEMLDINVYNGLGRESGARKFAEYWQVDSIDTPIWDVLDRILSLGGGFVRSEKGVQFCMPYVFTEFPDHLNIFEHGAVIRSSSTLMSQPSSGSDRLADLSYHLVKVADWQGVPDMSGTEGLSWLKVETLDKQEGFVRSDDIRSPSDYSACFLQNSRGTWRLTSLFSQQK